MLVRFRRRVSFVNAYPWLCSGRFAGGMIQPGAVFEEEPMTGAGVTRDDYEFLPDPRDDEVPATLALVESGCEALLEWTRAGHLPAPRRVIAERLRVLLDAAALLPDAPPTPFDAVAVLAERTLPGVVRLVKVLREWARAASPPQPEAGGVGQPGRRTGRPKKIEKDSATLVVAALSKWHGYEGGSVTNPEPATNRGLADGYGLSPNALSRFLKDRFPEEKNPHKKYDAACRNGTIGTLLALWNREPPSRHADLLPHESGREDDD